ncbi:hypothetical protein PGTUg99_037496 [Puccinia graminis f. sp. tritici]|uniref:Uncharacterized protein n=1 Tax=Puccinia graminis f. sp. tritici TaxID=56615 RepID=A0A5B0S6B9_PUCGR|nr:hypothetical protein PGTUg99_037496 [Puccinia graminis f. sp. tritici]
MRHKATGFGIIDTLFAHCPKPLAQFVVIPSFSALVNFSGTSRFFWALARDQAIPMA